ncbi:MAG TPA: nucleoside monophosphate kinase, partial [Chitinophagales bacterium]|nr:nucleoside monophosphate kinase [Chitinophagales bacterium]
FIFDGFPRTEPQAEALDKLLDLKNTSISLVLALEVGEDEITQRILERAKKSENPRADDLDERIIRNRFQVYLKQTSQVAEHYKKANMFVTLNGIGTIDEIFESLQTEINRIK